MVKIQKKRTPSRHKGNSSSQKKRHFTISWKLMLVSLIGLVMATAPLWAKKIPSTVPLMIVFALIVVLWRISPKPFDQREHIRRAVLLWGDRGPQPLFDVMSTLLTLCPEALYAIGVHTKSSVIIKANNKVPRALVPECSDGIQYNLCPVGMVSVTPKKPLDTEDFLDIYNQYLDGTLVLNKNSIDAIHILDMDFTDVDNATAMLAMQKALTNSNSKHPLFVFVSTRKMSAALAPMQVHLGENGPIKTIEGKMLFRVCEGNPAEYALTHNLGPYIKEQRYEANFHSKKDQDALQNFAVSVLVRQLRLQNPNNTAKVGKLGFFEKAGLSHNVHKLEWYMYNKDGSYKDVKEYNNNVCKYSKMNPQQRVTEFNKVIENFDQESTTSVDDMVEYLRSNQNTHIHVHCAGPMFILSELAKLKYKDLRKRVKRIGAMFLSHDGDANLLGRNFNEGVCPEMTEALWDEDGQNIHRLYPNAQILCVTTDTCKSKRLAFIP